MQNEKTSNLDYYITSRLRGLKRKVCEGSSCLKLGANLKTPKNAPETTNAFERCNGAIKRSFEHAHLTLFNFHDFLRQEQSAAETKLISLQAGRECSEMPNDEKIAPRIKKILEAFRTIELKLHRMERP